MFSATRLKPARSEVRKTQTLYLPICGTADFNTRRRKETEGGGDKFARVPAVDSGTKHRDHVSSAGALFLTSYLRVSGSWVVSFCFTYFILLKSYCQNFLKQTRYLKIKIIF